LWDAKEAGTVAATNRVRCTITGPFANGPYTRLHILTHPRAGMGACRYGVDAC
jgi:hypothetical protein